LTIGILFEKLKQWMQQGITGKLTILLHEGGIRTVRLEKDIKDNDLN